MFLPYLWGIETEGSCVCSENLLSQFLPYLWGIETRYDSSNGSRNRSYSFYPTYEALKPFRSYEHYYRFRVFTLPMRHWNRAFKIASWFLWLGFYPTYEALKRKNHKIRFWRKAKVFTLPMRHWNDTVVRSFKNSDGVFTLPMRHWNDLTGEEEKAETYSFYPTYEALKRSPNSRNKRVWVRFYPTYEALKLTIVNILKKWTFVFLPYLWGIETL